MHKEGINNITGSLKYRKMSSRRSGYCEGCKPVGGTLDELAKMEDSTCMARDNDNELGDFHRPAVHGWPVLGAQEGKS